MSDKTKNTNFDNYEKSFLDLKKSLEIISSKESSLDDVLSALDKGLKSYKICTKILTEAEQKVKEISLNYENGGKDEF